MDINKIKVCAIDQSEIETVGQIAVDAWEKIHAGYRDYIGNDDLYERLSKDWRKKKYESIKKKAEEDPENVLVAKDDSGKILGFITLDKIDLATGIGEIGNNAVLPEFQGNGIGKLLYKHALDIFRKKGLVYAVVNTGYEDAGHAGARAAYEKAGFKKMRTSITYSMKL